MLILDQGLQGMGSGFNNPAGFTGLMLHLLIDNTFLDVILKVKLHTLPPKVLFQPVKGLQVPRIATQGGCHEHETTP